MKKGIIYTICIIISCLLLGACNTAPPVSDSLPASSSSASVSSTPSAAPAPSSSETAAASDGLEIETVEYSGVAEWGSTTYSASVYSFEIPSSWQTFPEMSQGLDNVHFFTFGDADLDEQPSNVVVEITSTSPQDQDMDYGDAAVQESFFAYMDQAVFGSNETNSNLRYSVWQAHDRYIYIIDYDKQADGTSVHQTAYFPMGQGVSGAIYATDYSDDILPDVNDAARYIAVTLAGN